MTLAPTTLPAARYGYALGQQRLPAAPARLLGALTEQALRQAGICPGMRVLNIGCGAGDVALLAAQLVGPGGYVLGIDGDPAAVAAARRQAQGARLANVEIAVGGGATFAPSFQPDALVGRFALGALADPAAAVRRLSRFVRPGGLAVFLESQLGAAGPVPLSFASALSRQPHDGARWAELAIDTGAQLFTLFLRAGLPAPHMRLGAWADVEPDARPEELAALPALVGAWARTPCR